MAFEPRVHWTDHEQERTQWSNFWIMINSNLAGADEFDQSYLVTLMRQSIDKSFGSRPSVMKILHIIDGGGGVVTDERTRRKAFQRVERVESEAVVEIGPRVHRIHAHVLLMIQHKTRVQLNVTGLRESIREYSGGRFANPVVRVKLIRENPINAIRMYQRGYKNKLPTSLIRKVQRSHGLL